jgi:maltooligosyltrehalose trehalohydrolase
VGNRAFGDRLTAVGPPAAVRAVVAVYLLLPQVPMLFMGEEWGAAQPFPFFCDFAGELAEAVRTGRRTEFAKFPEFQDEVLHERIPDPQAPGTFDSAKLVWDERAQPGHAVWLDLYRTLLAVRRDRLLPLLAADGGEAGTFDVLGPGAVSVRWPLPHGAELVLEVNLSSQPTSGFPAPRGRTLWQEQDWLIGTAAAWYVRWSVI